MDKDKELLNPAGFAEDFREKVVDFLAHDIFGESAREKIKERYDAISSGDTFLEDFIPLDHPDFNELRKNKNCVIGLDFPIWNGVVSDHKPVMILCQDSGREVWKHKGRQEVVVNSLFGIHNWGWRNSGHGKKFNSLVKELNRAGYPVYASDCAKFYCSEPLPDIEEDKIGKNQSRNSQLDVVLKKNNIYQDLFKKELELVNPQAILLMGSVAQNFVKNTRKRFPEIFDGVKLINILHISYRYNRESNNPNLVSVVKDDKIDLTALLEVLKCS